jgi:hypothetical protein
MSIEASNERRGVGERGTSSLEINLVILNKVIGNMQVFKSLFLYSGYESREDSTIRMVKAYEFFGLKYDSDKNKFNRRRRFVLTKLASQRCSICFESRIIVEQPCQFLLPDCSHLVCANCYEKTFTVRRNIYFIITFLSKF